jgi:hypothetical protein
VTRFEQGQHVVHELVLAHGFAGLGIARGKQAAEEVLAAPAERAALIDDLAYPGAHAARGFAHGPLCRVRQPRGQAQKGVHDLPGDMLEVVAAALADARCLVRLAAGEHGAGDDGEGDVRHRLVDRLHRSGRGLPPEAELILGSPAHGRHIAQHLCMAEERSDHAPLPAPQRALGGENPLAEGRSEHPPLDGITRKGVASADEHLLDEGRRRNPGDEAALRIVEDDGLLVDRLRQPGKRVAHIAGDKAVEREGAGRRLDRRGIKRSALEFPGDHRASAFAGCNGPNAPASKCTLWV